MHKLLLFSAFLIFGLMACGGDDGIDCSDPQGAIAMLDAGIMDINNAVSAFNADPTNQERCEDLIQAYEDYLDLAESGLGCEGLNQQSLEFAINQARDNLQMIQCN